MALKKKSFIKNQKKMFKILINRTTNNYKIKGAFELPLLWDTQQKAIDNINYIKAHYDNLYSHYVDFMKTLNNPNSYKNESGYQTLKLQDLLSTFDDEFWFVGERATYLNKNGVFIREQHCFDGQRREHGNDLCLAYPVYENVAKITLKDNDGNRVIVDCDWYNSFYTLDSVEVVFESYKVDF